MKLIKLLIILLLSAFVLFLLCLFISWIIPLENNFEDNKESTVVNLSLGDIYEDKFYNSTEMHWTHMPLTYSFLSNETSNCSDKDILRINQAVEYIYNSTEGIISFQKKENESDITFLCPTYRKDEGFVIGEAIPSYYQGTSIFAPSVVYIYPASHCINQRPTIEIHEILHLMGLEHGKLNSWDDIMNPQATRCSAGLTNESLNYLKKIYG